MGKSPLVRKPIPTISYLRTLGNSKVGLNSTRTLFPYRTESGHGYSLKNASKTFQRLVEYVLRDMIGKSVIVFIDDILVFSDTLEDRT